MTQERDALLAEKTTWLASASSESTSQQWTVEREELIKARQEADAHVIQVAGGVA